MKKDNVLSKLNSSRISIAGICFAVFLLMLLCNFKTNLVADDYRYCFSFYDDSRMESLRDIIPSMAAHRITMNGRLIAHAFVQLFLMLPLPVFKIINSAMFTALIYLIYSIARRSCRHNALLLMTVFGAVWTLQPEFGQVYLWLDGSVNYLWCGVFCLLWLLPQISRFMSDREMSIPAQVLYCLFSLFVGAYSENSTTALVFMALLFIAAGYVYQHKEPALWQLLSLAAMLIGFAFMISAPGEIGNKSAESFSSLLVNFRETALYYLRFWPLIAVYVLLYSISRRRAYAKQLRILSLIFIGGSLAGHFVLTFALYCAGRSTYIALILLITACGLLFAEQFDAGISPLLCTLCAVCLAFTAYWGYIGVSDIILTNYKLSFNEQIISEAAANGEKDVQLPRIYAATKYSAIEGLPYLDTENTEEWTNVYMAKYYGVDTVIGY